MGDKSNIQWTEATWNPIVGCSRVSEGCRNCYAEREAANRLRSQPKYEGLAIIGGNGEPRWTGEVRLWERAMDQPKRWKRPRMIFVNSMSDLFHEQVPVDWINRIFRVMRECPQHTFQILTKRADRMHEYISGRFGSGGDDPLPNVWLGVSVENQETANTRLHSLLCCNAAILWVSLEPLLGPVNLRAVDDSLPFCFSFDALRSNSSYEPLDWVVVGGESGPNHRAMDPEWVLQIAEDCKDANVPFLFKQWGGRTPKSGGRLLNGREYNEFPRTKEEAAQL